MNLFYIDVILSAIAFSIFALAFLIFFEAERKLSNIFFGLLALSIGAFLSVSIGLRYANAAESIKWLYITENTQSIAAISISVFVLFFSFVFPWGSVPKKVIPIALGMGGLSALIAMVTVLFPNSPFVATAEYIPQPDAYNPVIKPGPGYIVHVILWIWFLGWAIWNFTKKYRRSKEEHKKQLRVIGANFAFGMGVAIVFDGLIPLISAESDTYWLGYFGPFVFIVSSTYTILKHRLFTVRVLAVHIVTFCIWVALFIRIFFSDTVPTMLFDMFLLTLTIVLGAYLIRSVLQEVRQKEQIETLAKDLSKANAELADLNTHLEEKVKEQTVEIRHAYEVEKKARHELEELDKAKTDFILTTQHHLRTPLTVVKGMLSLLKGKEKQLDQETAHFIDRADENAERLSKLVNEFLEISEMEVGKSILKKKNVDLAFLTGSVVQELETLMQEKGLRVEQVFPEEECLRLISLDEARFRDALLNILDNAVRYTPQGGTIRITGECDTHPIEKTKLYRLTIQDSGIGMTKEEQEELFAQAFRRSPEAKELNATGRGIGLMLTRQIIEAHGGTIRAESEGKGTGTRFVVEVPVGA